MIAAGDRNVGPMLRERLCNAATDARRPAGDQGDLSRKQIVPKDIHVSQLSGKTVRIVGLIEAVESGASLFQFGSDAVLVQGREPRPAIR